MNDGPKTVRVLPRAVALAAIVLGLLGLSSGVGTLREERNFSLGALESALQPGRHSWSIVDEKGNCLGQLRSSLRVNGEPILKFRVRFTDHYLKGVVRFSEYRLVKYLSLTELYRGRYGAIRGDTTGYRRNGLTTKFAIPRPLFIYDQDQRWGINLPARLRLVFKPLLSELSTNRIQLVERGGQCRGLSPLYPFIAARS